jgi:hypothetical protein
MTRTYTLPAPITTIHHLGGGWSNFEILQHDQGVHGLGAADGVLTKEELFARIADLKAQKAQLSNKGRSSLVLDFELGSATGLYNELSTMGVAAVQYLPESVMQLSESARRRATELLRINGTSELTPFIVDEAIATTQLMTASSGAALSSKQKALSELAAIKAVLFSFEGGDD